MASKPMMEVERVVRGRYTVRLRGRGNFGLVAASNKKQAENKVLDFIMNELDNNEVE